MEIPFLLDMPFFKTAGALIDVKEEKMALRVREKHVVFDMSKEAKRPMEAENCMRVEVIEPLVDEFFRRGKPKEPLESCIIHRAFEEDDDNKVAECALHLNSLPMKNFRGQMHFIELGSGKLRFPPSVEKPPMIKLKQLPEHLRYVFLGQSTSLMVIISSSLSKLEEEKLLRVLREHK